MQQVQKKYDRQIRIWGTHGQECLQNASICVLNAGACGAEVLKNLVLGGVTNFTVVDSRFVCDMDFGNNFLVGEDSLDVPRAEVVVNYLRELNEDAEGISIMETPETLIESQKEFFQKFTIIIATQVI